MEHVQRPVAVSLTNIKQMPEEEYKLNFLGNKVYPNGYWSYTQCNVCGLLVWHDSCVLGMCPLCLFQLPRFELEISFMRSRSKKYRTALKRAREIPTYVNEGDRHIVRFASLSEYCENRHAVSRLHLIIFQWVSFRAALNGEEVKSCHVHAIYSELERMKEREGAEDIVFSGNVPIFTYKSTKEE